MDDPINENKENETNDPEKLFPRRGLVFLSFAVGEFLYGASFSMMIIFFPNKAETIGVTDSQVGYIIGATGIGGVVSSFIYESCLVNLTRKAVTSFHFLLKTPSNAHWHE